MKSKQNGNAIALPAAFVSLVLILVISLTRNTVAYEVPEYNLLQIILIIKKNGLSSRIQVTEIPACILKMAKGTI